MVFGFAQRNSQEKQAFAPLPYRLNVGIVLVNDAGKIFVGKRSDKVGKDEGWQLPQGGVDHGESPSDALWRELGEELGTRSAEIVAHSPRPLSYDFPETVRAQIYDGKYRGQMQHWYLLRFVGDDADINIRQSAGGHPAEFSDFAWSTPDMVLQQAVAFKRPIYENVLYYFDEYIAYNRR
jgi:putative (di)nucleoside polyphosphate hydrolase